MAEIIINGTVHKLSCTMTDCKNGMHSFKSSKRLEKSGLERGLCIECRSSLVDWERVHKRDLSDFDYLRGALKLEMVRKVFWEIKEPDEKMLASIRGKSRDEIKNRVQKRLRTTLSKPRKDNPWDGRQTPFDGNIINWAQHATGTCCRICVEYWHGIDAISEISEADYDYLEQIIMNYLDEKVMG